MELDQRTQAFIEGIKQTINQTEQEIVKDAVESRAEELGKQLIMQQGAQQQKNLEADED